jgi:WD40 repeat protein/serine/threonine protein kinase
VILRQALSSGIIREWIHTIMGGDSLFGSDPRKLKGLIALGFDSLDGQEIDPGLPTAADVTFVEAPGDRIGPYRLLSVLGEGGMGTVYLAEQARPVRRCVALKIIKPGMDSRNVLRRFEAEEQALALMEHPHIARVYDAGLAPSGRPYFVMEHVKGIPINEHCDRHNLTVEQRLQLFLRVCEAVQHAHQKGIIHRDLKPSNILVAIEDQEMVPKVIDFGVARAISQPLTQQTLYTEQGQQIGTPEYMSPEQATLTSQDIDTRTDIYSLGVLLYELLTGYTPFAPKDLRDRGCAEMQRIICEQDPVRPSTKLTMAGNKLEGIAKRRDATPEQLQRSVRGDLDWIVMKCLEKNRTRRYQTANALAADIKCHLDHEPVTARPASRLYRFWKLVRRNRGVFAAIGTVAAVLMLGITVTTREAVRATRAEGMQSRLRLEAVAARDQEARWRRQAQAEAYASDMSVAQQALAANDLGRTRRLLEAHRPAPGQVDLRGWEWRYLWQECRSDALGELCRYPNSVYSVAYSPDGRMLAVTGLIQRFVEIWDVPSRRRIATLQPTEGLVVAFSPRGDLLATDAGERIRLWRSGTKDSVAELTLSGAVRVLKFSPDGTRLASLSNPDELTVWEVDRRTIMLQQRGFRLRGVFIGVLDFSPDGRSLVVGDADQRLRVIDLPTGDTRIDVPEAHTEGVTSVAWSPNGSIIASGGGYTGGPIHLWDAASGKPLGTLEGHTSWTSELIFSTNGRWLYSANADQTIRIWDVEQRRCLAVLHGSTDEIYGLALSPDGTTLASAGRDRMVAFWNASPRPEGGLSGPIASGGLPWATLTFAPDGRVLAAPRPGTVSLYNPETSEGVEQIPALGADVQVLDYSPDGVLLASGGERGKARVWSCAERRLLRELGDRNAPVRLLRFRADGMRLLAVDAAGNAIWWDTHTWQAVRTFRVEPLERAAVSPNGRLLAAGTGAGVVRWLDAETGELLATTTDIHRHRVTAIAFSGDGSRAASVAEDGTVAIWDPSSLQPIAVFKGHMLAAHGVAFSPDGRRLVTGGTGREAIKLWDLSTYRELVTLSGQGSLFGWVAFSPNGRWLAARDMKGELYLWRAPSWDEIQAVEKRPEGGQSP